MTLALMRLLLHGWRRLRPNALPQSCPLTHINCTSCSKVGLKNRPCPIRSGCEPIETQTSPHQDAGRSRGAEASEECKEERGRRICVPSLLCCPPSRCES